MATFGRSMSSRLLLVAVLLALASSGAHGFLGDLLNGLPIVGSLLGGLSTNPADSALPDVPAVFPPVAAGKLVTRNMLAFCIKVNLDSSATQIEEPTITILPGQTGDVPIMAVDPTTKSQYRVSVYYDPPTPGPATCKGRYTVFATNGPLSARVVAAAGYRAVLPGFCTGGDVKEITGLIVSGFADPQGIHTNVRTQFECAKKIASGQDP